MSELMLTPDWVLPKGVRALVTNVPEAAQLPSPPRWLTQVHGPLVVNADDADATTEADGAWTSTPGVVCAVRTADCLPALFSDRRGSIVAASHAGWRGLCSGILDLTAQRFFELDVPPDAISVWLGPAIGPAAYEVDAAVYDMFMQRTPDCAAAFAATRPGHWNLDLYKAARMILAAQGVTNVCGGDYCTYSDDSFYSYRRDPECGRQAACIWME